jgi:hypothetical protein
MEARFFAPGESFLLTCPRRKFEQLKAASSELTATIEAGHAAAQGKRIDLAGTTKLSSS